MHQLGNIKFFVIFSILVLAKETFGLKCWRCSSDTTTSSNFCEDIVDVTQATDQQKKYGYVECSTKTPPGVENIENEIVKCRLLQQVGVNGTAIYSRSCYYEQKNQTLNSCQIAVQKSQEDIIKIVRCQTCAEDGCNAKFSEEKRDQKNSAIFAVLSNTAFIILVLSAVIGSSDLQMYL